MQRPVPRRPAKGRLAAAAFAWKVREVTYRNSIIAAFLLAALAPSAAAESVVPKPKLRPAQPSSSESAPQREAAAPSPRLRPARGAADEDAWGVTAPDSCWPDYVIRPGR